MPTRQPAAASSTASAGAPRSTNAPTAAVTRSRSLFFWALALPAVTLALCVLVPACLRYTTLQHGQSFAILTNTTIINYPENFDTRYRGPEYASYDRFFFQWWNFLVYDAETHDHWTIVYHAQRFSSTAKQPHYAMTSMVHKRGPVDQSVAVEAFPLERMTFTDGSWDVAMTRQDGTVPHRVTVIDADTYNVVASYLPEDVTIGQRVSWNLTFHRVHGVFSSRDSEARNVEHCSVASTLFGYHSRVTGWIQEGDVRREFGADEAASTRYRAYAAGSWGCKLPAGYPTIEYPWTWAWLVIPGEKDSVSGAVTRPDIGLVLGTARFQSNVSLVGDLFGGYAVLGVGADLHTHTFADVHHGRTFEVPLVRASTDEYLRVLELEYGNWTDIVDPSGTYRVPLRQTYVIESAHYRARLDFHSRAEQYFRLPIVLEHRSTEEAANDPEKPLAVFSDFRACGVRTHVQIWHREHTLAEQAAVQSQQRRQHQLTGVPPPSKTEEAAPSSSVDAASLAAAGPGGWTSVVHDGWVDSLNALEFAYQAPLADEEMYRVYTQPQFKKPRMHAQAQAQKKREAAEAVEAKAKKAQQ